MSREERVEAKRADLLEVFADLPEKQLRVASDLIDQAAFMAVTLEDLAVSISENGTVEEYTNGANQSGRKISSDAKLYSSLISKYTALVAKLLQLIPGEKKTARIEEPTAEEDPASAAVEAQNRHKAKQDAFFAALKSGEVRQDQYKEFCAAWDQEHSA